jgi:hypothetical protein
MMMNMKESSRGRIKGTIPGHSSGTEEYHEKSESG